MSLLRHIHVCNTWDAARFRPLIHGGTRVGLVRDDNAAQLADFPAVFRVGADAVEIVAPGDRAALTARIDDVVEALVTRQVLAKYRHEYFAVAERWGAKPRFDLDRGAVAFFGARAYGVHLNGWRNDGGTLKFWIGRRAPDKLVAPDKLDNLVAGGIGRDHGLVETLLKEGEEEAAMPRALTARATPVGAISYRMSTRDGVRDDVLFIYDIEAPADFTPHNTDGEIVSFALMDAADVVRRVRDTDDFKFNVNLVIIDFALRHGIVTPDDPEYLALVTGLHRPLD
jgi:8-oxo-dGTP pyrophosphatase MutT (NUDIX family)